MLRFVAANLDSDGERLERAMAATHLPRVSLGRRRRIGLGWHIFRALCFDVITHSGGTGGSRSFIGLDKARRTAVVVLANSSLDIDDIGLHLLDDRHALTPPNEITLVAAALKRRLRSIDPTLRGRRP